MVHPVDLDAACDLLSPPRVVEVAAADPDDELGVGLQHERDHLAQLDVEIAVHLGELLERCDLVPAAAHRHHPPPRAATHPPPPPRQRSTEHDRGRRNTAGGRPRRRTTVRAVATTGLVRACARKTGEARAGGGWGGGMRRALPFARDDGGLVSCGGAARARKRAGRTAAGGVATRTHGMVRSLLLCSRRTRSFLSMPSSRGSTLSRFFGAAASEDESARAESPDRFERT